MLSKILELKNVKVLQKIDQRNISGGNEDHPVQPVACPNNVMYAFCEPYSNVPIVDPCIVCVN
ncbi:hypothetical protein [uncultured Kordia sp.]|uniref:hypothetical protein n=1 Tax=uncultured Kordia sp. TaxID=507699 RepID=UPI00263948C6|nr:hypothetical protein [uncultured Kordia sp.]